MVWLIRIKDGLLSKIRKKISRKELESIEKTIQEKNNANFWTHVRAGLPTFPSFKINFCRVRVRGIEIDTEIHSKNLCPLSSGAS